jgi:hypothetical protein
MLGDAAPKSLRVFYAFVILLFVLFKGIDLKFAHLLGVFVCYYSGLFLKDNIKV